MKRIKLYLDTSIPSFLFADDAPEKKEATKQFWNLLRLNIHDVVISDILLFEIGKSSQPLRAQLEEAVSELEKAFIPVTEEADKLAQLYIHYEIIPEKYYDDALHIALATISNCDALLSWNFKHIVKLKTMRGINAINKLEGYSEIQLLTPQSWLEGDENE